LADLAIEKASTLRDNASGFSTQPRLEIEPNRSLGGVEMSSTSEEVLDKHARWLDLEERAQREQWEKARKLGLKALEAEGYAIRGLLARDDRSAMLGRMVLVCERTYGPERGGFKLGANDPVVVRLQAEPETHAIKAVLNRLTPRSVEIIFDEPPEAWVFDEVIAIELGPNDVTYQRMRAGIVAMREANNALRSLRDRVLAITPAPAPERVKKKERQDFNAPQNDALDQIAARPPLFLLHGPPGTGKTTVLSQAIAEAVAAEERVLACTPSNQALDNLAHALRARGVDFLRLGHPSRVDPALHDNTLDGKLAAHPQRKVIDELQKQARKLFREASQKKLQGRSLDAREQAFALRKEGQQMMAEARGIEKRALQHVLDTVPVVLATLTGLREDVIDERTFDLGVIDEGTQAVVPAIYPMLARVSRLVIGGDHRQLGPTVLSKEADKDGMGKSAFERLMQSKTPPPSVMLSVQYRMHQAIMAYPSRALYEDKLEAHPSAATRSVDGWPALLFVDTAGRGFDEQREAKHASVFNSGEADLALDLARRIVAVGVAPEDIGVLSPYDAQVQRIRNAAEETEDLQAIDVSSIDGFQGREKEVIILSLVRSNEAREIGFLSELRRLNVALTRARRALVVIGDSATVTSNEFYSAFVDHAIAAESHKSAWEFA
jgi:ATP-dependent RNA/DNA helicase IGHMBP2